MQATIVRNSLISRQGIAELLRLPRDDLAYASLLEILTRFQDIKQFASEIHTEIHLIKPILKILGFAYESKPKYFDDHIKGPDVALFTSESERDRTSSLWGTPEYYANTLGVLLLKRFGRNLEEGVSGFFLAFENGIPLYQLFYYLKNTKTPWGVLTNGKHWMLMKKPLSHETRVFSIDLEETVQVNDRDALHLFCSIFSLNGLSHTLGDLYENERQPIIARLQEKQVSVRSSIAGFRKKMDIFPRIIGGLSDIFGNEVFTSTRQYLTERDVWIQERKNPPDTVDDFNVADISTFLLSKKGGTPTVDLERIFSIRPPGDRTKDALLSLKVLDMTPGFGNLSIEIVECLAYLSFVLPYRERNGFIAQWEDEKGLKRFILENVIYGIERSNISFDILHYALKSRYGYDSGNFKFGNPLIGMSLADIAPHADRKDQAGLFAKNPLEILTDVRDMYRLFFSLSDRIKEDLVIKEELSQKLNVYCNRLRDIMDLITATYFVNTIDQRKIHESLSALDSDSAAWDSMTSRDWFVEAKALARQNGFFHLELEFPFLVNGAFDYIFVQPSQGLVWEEPIPVADATKAYIIRGMTYLKPNGTMVFVLDHPDRALVEELSRSKKYETFADQNLILLSKRT
jgi:hypothetical protein